MTKTKQKLKRRIGTRQHKAIRRHIPEDSNIHQRKNLHLKLNAVTCKNKITAKSIMGPSVALETYEGGN
jgi:hypothetical protein